MTKFLRYLVATLMCVATMNAFAQNEAEITTVLDADFTQFTEGTPSAPVSFPSYGTGSFTSFFPSWFVSKVAQAGGAVLIQDGGYLSTSYQNLSGNNGVARITVRFRAVDSYGCGIKVSMGYSSSSAVTHYQYDNEWHTMSFIISGGSSSTRVRVEPVLSASGILIESLKVEQSASFFAAPVASQPNVADATSFTATWSSVSGTTHYYLDVYSYNATGAKDYFMQNEDCGTSRSKRVTGLDPAKTYFYVVRASNGTATSDDSNEIEVVPVISSIDTPEVDFATVSDGKATITWSAVENAQSYIVNLYRHTTLAEAAETDVLNEDFAGVTEGSLSSIEFTYNYKLDQYTNMKGWDGDELGLAAGYMVLTPFSGSEGALVTPALDLSDNNGMFTVTVGVAESAYGTMYSGGILNVKVLDADDNVLNEGVIELQNGFNEYKLSFEKGDKTTRIGFYYSGSYKVFFDSVVVSQEKPAGSVINEMIAEENVTDTSFTFDYTPQENIEIGFTVMAVGRTVSGGEITDITSEPSAEKYVSQTSAIDNIAAENYAVSVNVVAPGSICVDSRAAVKVTVYDIAGRVIASAVAEGQTIIETGYRGIAIVKAGEKAFKVKL